MIRPAVRPGLVTPRIGGVKAVSRPSSPAVAWQGSEGLADSTDLVKRVEERLRAHKSPKSTLAIKKLTQEHGLSDEVQLALRLLAPEQLKELLAGGEDLQQKLAEVPNKNQLMRSLVSMLDPDVDQLVNGLQELEQDEQATHPHTHNSSAPRGALGSRHNSIPPASTHSTTAEIAAAASQLLPGTVTPVLIVTQTGPQPDSAMTRAPALFAEQATAGRKSNGDLVREAQRRLAANRSATSVAAISKFTRDHELADEVQLALRMLEPGKLEELLAGEADIQQKFAEVEDRNALMLSLVSMLDADVVRLVSRLQELERGEQAESGQRAEQAEPDPGGEDLVAEAQRRLAASKTATSVAAIEKFAQDHTLSDEVQLALRMLQPSHLEELLAGEEDLTRKFAEVPDRDQLMMSLVAMLDPEVEKLVSRLQEIDQGREESPERSSEDLVAEAQQRLQDNKSPLSTAAIKRLTHDHGLSDEVQLGLRLLAPPQLKELMAGGKELREKLERVNDKNQLMLSLVKMLDPDVDRLVHGLMRLDGQGSAAPQAAPAKPPSFVPLPRSRTAGPGSAASVVAPTKTKAKSVAPAPTRNKAQPPKRDATSSAVCDSSASGDEWDDWGDWRGDQKRQKAAEDNTWKATRDTRWKGAGDTSWKGAGDTNWKGTGDTRWKGTGDNQSWSWRGWQDDGWKASGDVGGGRSRSWQDDRAGGWQDDNGHGAADPEATAKGRAVPPRAQPVVALQRIPAQALVEAPSAALAEAAAVTPAAGGASKKKPKCMICRGDHRAADCPKMK
mmetsp:Transcript_78964/g.218533  ORF Transcript_78964/g.218533 Transcript_78964/m.218533 type:complete len:786 (+) Transcript_78964:93-2450(+)